MKVQLEHILQNLFSKPSLNEVQLNELQELVHEHPYFSAGHFLLAQKLKHQHNGEYEAQAQKAALYFHDPLWMQWQLKAMANGKELELEPEEELAVTTVGPVEEGIPATPQEMEENLDIEEQPNEFEPSDDSNFHELETEPTPEAEQEPGSATEPEPNQETETAAAPQPVNDTQVAPEPAYETGSASQPIHQAVATESASQPNHQTETSAFSGTIPGTDPAPSSETKEPGTEPIAFDPYYTIDYFASQGIKVAAEIQPGDKLGKQLKSFTEWLKTMKRLPQTPPPAEAVQDEAEQQSIRQIAAGSLEQKEVVTETMAEVLQKQGRNAEAIAIYEKLSLSDPSKSAYFAAKIENLKEN